MTNDCFPSTSFSSNSNETELELEDDDEDDEDEDDDEDDDDDDDADLEDEDSDPDLDENSFPLEEPPDFEEPSAPHCSDERLIRFFFLQTLLHRQTHSFFSDALAEYIN